MKLLIKKPTTLKVVGSFNSIVVLKDNVVFYQRVFDKTRNEAFVNLPDVGVFDVKINGSNIKIGLTDLVKSKKIINLPPIQKNTKLTLGKYQIIKKRGFDGSPASIHTTDKKIYLNDRFFELPIYAQKFIMFHELGHRFYSSEFACDLYATKKMLEKGYNESSCVLSLSNVLRRTPFNTKRVENILGDLLT
jgi:hypothetical protein